MSANAHGPDLERPRFSRLTAQLTLKLTLKGDFGHLNERDCEATIRAIRQADGWWAVRVGPVNHRYCFAWRWKDPETAILAVQSLSHWQRIRKGCEMYGSAELSVPSK
jgi:hypothetical protein